MIQTFSIGDTGAEMVAKFNGLIAAVGSQFIYSVDNYKLPGDPDDTLAFQRCVADLNESIGFVSGGGTIVLAGRQYVISSTIVISKSFTMIGAGSDSGTQILLAPGANCNMFEIGKRYSNDPISVTMIGMRIEMLGSQADGYSNIVTYNYLRHCHFIDLFVVHATAPNFDMRVDSGYNAPRNNYFYGCAFEYGKVASLRMIHDYNLNINSCYFGFGVAGQSSHGLHVSMSADRFILANSWFLQDNRAGDMFLTGVQNGHIVNNKFSPTADGDTGSYNIYLGSCNQINVGGNIFQSTGFTYHVRTGNGSNFNIYDNQFGGAVSAPFSFLDKTKVRCNNNSFNGKYQENTGEAIIPSGATYVDVTHNIISTPDNVIATPRGSESVWVSDVGATTFRINRAASIGDLACNWVSSVKTY